MSSGKFRFGRLLSGCRMGIVGLGHIGSAIARRAQGFGLEVAYHGPNRKPQVPYPYFDSVVDLAERSDILVASCIGGAATRHIVNRAALAALGPDGWVINVSRGTVIDQEGADRGVDA